MITCLNNVLGGFILPHALTNTGLLRANIRISVTGQAINGWSLNRIRSRKQSEILGDLFHLPAGSTSMTEWHESTVKLPHGSLDFKPMTIPVLDKAQFGHQIYRLVIAFFYVAKRNLFGASDFLYQRQRDACAVSFSPGLF